MITSSSLISESLCVRVLFNHGLLFLGAGIAPV
jgi:hypothetical protein